MIEPITSLEELTQLMHSGPYMGDKEYYDQVNARLDASPALTFTQPREQYFYSELCKWRQLLGEKYKRVAEIQARRAGLQKQLAEDAKAHAEARKEASTR